MNVVPTETIYDIAKLLLDDVNSLSTLSIINRRFHGPANTVLYETVSDVSLPTLIMENTFQTLQPPLHHVLHLSAKESMTSPSLLTECFHALQENRGSKRLHSLHLDYPSVRLENLFPAALPSVVGHLDSLSISCSAYNWPICYSTINALWCPTLKHLKLNFCSLFHPREYFFWFEMFPPDPKVSASYAELAQCFTAMPVALPVLCSLHIGLPACYTATEIPVLQLVFDGNSLTFPNLIELDIECRDNSIAFDSFLLRHPNIMTFGLTIAQSENVQVFNVQHLPVLVPNLQSFRGSVSHCFHLVESNSSRPIKSLTLRTSSLQGLMFLQLLQILRTIVTLEDLDVQTKDGLVLGHVRGIIKETCNLLRLCCNFKTHSTDDDSADVAGIYDVVLCNLPRLREFCARFHDSNSAHFRLLHKLAIRSAVNVGLPTHSLPITVKVYTATDVLPAVIFRDNCFC
ncbi:hypothetical protein F5877DRAFT_79277 [Lentinula edodes]|nr:hypothetical protein F5877DRAFT_79277 [Lentinula edodes]